MDGADTYVMFRNTIHRADICVMLGIVFNLYDTNVIFGIIMDRADSSTKYIYIYIYIYIYMCVCVFVCVSFEMDMNKIGANQYIWSRVRNGRENKSRIGI